MGLTDRLLGPYSTSGHCHVNRKFADLIQSDGTAIAVTPLMRKRIDSPQLVARCEEEQRRAHAVGDMQFSQRLHHRLHAVRPCHSRHWPLGTAKQGPYCLSSAASRVELR
jgi:hypothetical protein